MCLHVPFHVKKRYTLVRELGIGAYGCVALAYDEESERQVAIKKVSHFFDQEVLARRTLREVASLSHLVECPNIVQILDFDVTFIELNEVYFILKACDADLSQIIRSEQELTEAHIRFFMVQLLRGVHSMHTAHIIHRDLKPGNLLVNTDCRLYVCDFGMSRAFESGDYDYLSQLSRVGADTLSSPISTPDGQTQDPFAMGTINIDAHRRDSPLTDTSDRAAFMQFFYSGGLENGNERDSRPVTKPCHIQFPGGPLTDYVATRWYRAPEALLRFKEGYTPAMDMWSVGCILAELLGRRPLFPGSDYMDQLSRINSVLGGPSESLLGQVGSTRVRHHVESLPPCAGKEWSELYPEAPEPALDLLGRLIQWDPEKRMTAGEALAHPWLKRYWQGSLSTHVPTPFRHFSDVEMVHTPDEFKWAFEHQSDQVKALWTAERQADAHQDDSSSTALPPSKRAAASGWSHSSPQSAGAMTMDSSASSSSELDSMHEHTLTEPFHDNQSCMSMSPATTKPSAHERSAHPSETFCEQKIQRTEPSGFSLLNRARAFMNWN
ncbi:hypothetical protein MNAN1_003350 [Malassezia nana]|uniref:Mitogen-activated protein kinase n=1 Tax=Malassezia nana TaxID=180528 RepID=A0AAF0J3M9_9BASI|nr:hypothetical protein MNAN1_003350 [Malassezia nana]